MAPRGRDTSRAIWGRLVCVLVATQLLAVSAGSSSTGKCRCLSTESCWPSQAAFAALEANLSQPLLAPQQLAKPCYDSPTSDECQTVQQSWTDGWWRSNSSHSAGGTENTNFAAYSAPDGHIEACFLNTTLGYPCLQGSIPTVGVDVRSVEDIQLAINFAVTHNLRVVVKNTGHDYFGRSTARGGFLIWTHHLKNITYHDTFKPSGAPSNGTVYSDAMTLGSGIQWQEAYDAAFAHGRDIVGGIAPGASVGAAGGWVQGGGHSILSPQYGLGVDNVLEMSIVTSDGKYHVVNAYQEPDLFWALRGGGGGTWGVVVSVTYQTHPSTPILAAFFTTSITTSALNATTTASATLRTLLTEFVRVAPAMTDSGWGGYGMIEPSSDTGERALSYVGIAPASASNASAVMEGFFAFAQQLAESASPEDGALNITNATIVALPNFATWETALFRGQTGEVGANVELGSRLLPRELFVNNQTAVADAALSLEVPYVGFYVVAGGAVSRVDPDSVALNPAWRSALAHVVFSAGWADGASRSTIDATRSQIKQSEAALRALTPGGGAYFNEASLYEVDFQQTFFGSHYDRLRAIKKQYDPSDLFIVPEGVGSEDWDADLNCRA
ncbi:FAD-binding domain-containing protein [Phanerochaete sordida]|uniref:FAD-binding domain-containing protein n=1 Tax=Phanerochaete sordida TaxID=48140 RepID=A0A9P3GRD2_9APHY|nr:FAD-binding domain-containing protein [Phanerochaete sordida]